MTMTTLTGPAEAVAARYLAAARAGRPYEEPIVADCVDGVPLERVEAALRAAGVRFHQVPLTLHWRAPGEMPRLVLDGAD